MTDVGALLANRFELRRQLAEDARTTVWEGFDAALERRVLIKLLRPELAADPAAVERFRQESRSAARAGSTPTGKILDAGFDTRGSVPFAVFEWQEGVAHGGGGAPRDVDTDVDADRTQRLVMPPVRRPAERPSGNGRRAMQRLGALLLVVPVVAGGVLVRHLLDDSSGAAAKFVPLPDVTIAPTAGPARPLTPVPTVAAAAPTRVAATPGPAPAQVNATQASATRLSLTQVPAGTRRRVVNTDGLGVALRATPGGDRLPGKGYDEGATVTLLEQSGAWSHIRGDDGREGWVLSVTLG